METFSIGDIGSSLRPLVITASTFVASSVTVPFFSLPSIFETVALPTFAPPTEKSLRTNVYLPSDPFVTIMMDFSVVPIKKSLSFIYTLMSPLNVLLPSATCASCCSADMLA